RILPSRDVRTMCPLPRRCGTPGRNTAETDQWCDGWFHQRRGHPVARDGASHARCLDLWTWPNGFQRARISPSSMEFFLMNKPAALEMPPVASDSQEAPAPLMPVPRGPIPVAPEAGQGRMVEIKIDGQAVAVPEGATILDAGRKVGINTPTLCFLESLTPV